MITAGAGKSDVLVYVYISYVPAVLNSFAGHSSWNLYESLNVPARRRYFYCDFGDEWSTSSGDVMRSILVQLLRQLHDHSVHPASVLDDLMKAKKGTTEHSAMRRNSPDLHPVCPCYSIRSL